VYTLQYMHTRTLGPRIHRKSSPAPIETYWALSENCHQRKDWSAAMSQAMCHMTASLEEKHTASRRPRMVRYSNAFDITLMSADTKGMRRLGVYLNRADTGTPATR
jgi:hypothetical protein